ncbi:MAG: hypothetical protein EBS11_27745 [Janthinobacterium sp.]|nr:hypothetical protein [Janthinobacterium sp.]
MVRRGSVVSFVDAVELLTVDFVTTCNIFEIKPRIATVFGIVRQAKAMLTLAESCIPAALYYCHVIVPHDDPMLADLRKEWPHTWAWGARFEDGEE